MKARWLAYALVALATSACGGGAGASGARVVGGGGAVGPSLELHDAGGRPRLAIVRREGDPLAAVAIEVRIDALDGEAPAASAALGAVWSARLSAAGLREVETMVGARMVRIRALASSLDERVARAIDTALTSPLVAGDPALPAMRRALERFDERVIDDPVLARASRCLDRAVRPPSAPKLATDPASLRSTIEHLEGRRTASVTSSNVIVAIVGHGTGLDELAHAWSSLPPYPASRAHVDAASPSEPVPPGITLAAPFEGGTLVVDGLPRAAVPGAIAHLSAPTGPLASRLRAADGFRLRMASGAARAEGGCIVVDVERPTDAGRPVDAERLATKTAVALEIARQEIELSIDEEHLTDDAVARLAIAEGADPREAADRAAWWAWPAAAKTTRHSSFALSLSPSRISRGPSPDVEASVAALTPKLASAIDRAKISAARPELELRQKNEPGQGELWMLLGTPCGTGHEGANDAGLGALAMSALVATAHNHGARDGVDRADVSAWSAPSGLGLVVHAPSRAGESSAALARRIGDVAGRVMLATFPEPDDVTMVRGEAMVHLREHGAAGDLVRGALFSLSPEHPSWLDGAGTFDAVTRIGRESLELRLSTLRDAPLRLAVIANAPTDRESTEQVEALDRALERWLPRRPGESRVCPIVDAPAPPKGTVHLIHVRGGAGVAFALPIEESQREAAQLLAIILGGSSGRIAKDIGDAGLAASTDVRFVRGLGRHALVIAAIAPDANIDAIAAQVRTTLGKLRGGAIEAVELARALEERANALTLRRLDPRARVVDLFLGDATAAAMDLSALKAHAARMLEEDHTHAVVARSGG